MAKQVFALGVAGIVVTINEDGTGTIKSKLDEHCSFCNEIERKVLDHVYEERRLTPKYVDSVRRAVNALKDVDL